LRAFDFGLATIALGDAGDLVDSHVGRTRIGRHRIHSDSVGLYAGPQLGPDFFEHVLNGFDVLFEPDAQ
jgi:hypothetical protein